MRTKNDSPGHLVALSKTVACVALLLAGLSGSVRADNVAGQPAAAAGCILATVDGVAVTQADADALRSLLQPPPPADATRRLAVDAALAWWDAHGWLAGSSARGRLDAWRAWLSVGAPAGVEAFDVRRAADDLARVASRAGINLGPCADEDTTVAAGAVGPATGLSTEVGSSGGRGARAAALLTRSSADSASARLLFVPASVGWSVGEAPLPAGAELEAIAADLGKRAVAAELLEIVLPLRQLEPALALALASMDAGAIAGPVRTAGGVYWIERR